MHLGTVLGGTQEKPDAGSRGIAKNLSRRLLSEPNITWARMTLLPQLKSVLDAGYIDRYVCM